MKLLFRILVCCAGMGVLFGTPLHADEAEVPPLKGAAPPGAEPVGDKLVPMTDGPNPIIELYTMGRGSFVVEKFGHAALCVRYPKTPSSDTCYNYGTTDFGDPMGLGWGFVRGRANFWVSTTHPSTMLSRYRSRDRTIWLQRLPLSRDQAIALEQKLLADDGMQYTYHHFFDNCTTRVRDIVDNAFDGALSKDSNAAPGPTFRQYGRAGFAEQTWLLLVSDVLLGRSGDDKPTLWQAMFLPRILRDEVTTRIGVRPQLVYERRGRDFADSGTSTGRGWVLLLALLLAIPVGAARLTRRFERTTAALSALPIGLLGLALWALAVITSLPELRYNEALLVFMPWDLALPALGTRRRVRYARIRVVGLILVSLLLAVGVLSQPLWVPLLCVLLPLGVIASGSMVAPPRREQEPETQTESEAETEGESESAAEPEGAANVQSPPAGEGQGEGEPEPPTHGSL